MGGGGNSAGSNDWPGYMKQVHYDWLNHSGQDGLKYSVTALISRAQGNSPYGQFVAVNPVTYFVTPKFTVFDVLDTFKSLDVTKLWSQTQADVLNSDVLLNAVKSHSTFLHDELETNILPKFRAGMRNINAVMSTSFVIGETQLHNQVIKALSKFTSEVQLKLLDLAYQVYRSEERRVGKE